MAYEISHSKKFLKFSLKLSVQHQKHLALLLELLEENPFNPKLHTKLLSGKLAGFYSFRITREYRVMFRFAPNNIIELVDIAHRKDVYR